MLVDLELQMEAEVAPAARWRSKAKKEIDKN